MKIYKAHEVYNEHLPTTVKDWAKCMKMTTANFSVQYIRHFNKAPIHHINVNRVEFVEKAIKRNPEMTFNEIAELTGFLSGGDMYKFIKYHTGNSPSAIRKLHNIF